MPCARRDPDHRRHEHRISIPPARIGRPGLDRILHECWQAGVVLGGVSAGSLCWHVGGTTDSFGPQLQPVTNCLGWLPYANGVHYDSEPQRRPLLHRLVAEGCLPTAYATDDGVGLIYRGTEMTEAVADAAGKLAYLVERGEDNRAHETPITPRLLNLTPAHS